MPPSRNADDSDPDILDALPADAGSEILDAVPDFTEDIRLAWSVLRSTDEDDHDAILSEMRRAGVSTRLMALRLYQFIPIAWGRFFLAGMGVYLPDEFLVRDRRTGEFVRDRFSECELYQQVREWLLPRVSKVTSPERDRVLRHSSEMCVFRQMVREGSRPADLMLGPPILT